MAKPACADRPLRWAAARHPHPGVVDLDAAPAKAAAAAPPSLHRADRHAAANAWCISDVAATVPMSLYLQAAAAVVFVLSPRVPRTGASATTHAPSSSWMAGWVGTRRSRLPYQQAGRVSERAAPLRCAQDPRANATRRARDAVSSGRAQLSWLKKGIGLSRFLGDAILPRLTTGRRTRMDLHTSARTHTRTIPSPFIRSHSQPHSNSLLAIT